MISKVRKSKTANIYNLGITVEYERTGDVSIFFLVPLESTFLRGYYRSNSCHISKNQVPNERYG